MVANCLRLRRRTSPEPAWQYLARRGLRRMTMGSPPYVRVALDHDRNDRSPEEFSLGAQQGTSEQVWAKAALSVGRQGLLHDDRQSSKKRRAKDTIPQLHGQSAWTPRSCGDRFAAWSDASVDSGMCALG